MKPIRYVSVVFAAFLPVLAIAVTNGGCSKKDSDAPVASTAPPPPTPAPPASTPAAVVPEEPDAGPDADAAADAAKPHGGGPGGGSGNIARCCADLRRNAASAPMEQRANYALAAQTCEGLKNTPAAHMAFAQIRSFLAGAKMPGACQ